MRISLLAIVAGTISLGACATVTRGTTEQLTFDSDPPAAMRTSTGLTCPTTPCTLEVNRKSEFVATFSKEGYKSQDVMVQTRVAGSGAAGFAGNVLIGGLIGMGVDAATGSTLEHYPNPVSANLEPLTLRGKPGKRPVRGPVKEEAPPTS
ncbi:translation initiation factor 2 [Microvirga sp. TS319]|uniref:translation initiation factor 2 n=1 Tax=Microvirga sp. TS319 TaxID=3241165 RepID=UPI00351A0C28